MEKLTGTQRVWITDSSHITPRQIQAAIASGDTDAALNRLHFTNSDMAGVSGWIEVGTAEVVVTLNPEEQVIEQVAEGLRTSIRLVKAEAQQRVTQLEERLSQLLALPNLEQGAPQ